MSRLEVTVLEKANGPLTKKIRLSANGDIHSDGAACALAHGRARRFGFDRLSEFSRLIEGFRDNQAITLGRLADGLPAMVDIVPKRRLNGAAAPAGAISRTLDFFGFRPGEFGFCLLDVDRKAMPPAVAERIARLGGAWPALVSVVPDLAQAARLERASTSAGLFDGDTGRRLAESGGAHIYIVVRDGADIARFLRDLHQRCWLAGLGWLMVGRAGQLLERSIIDASVGSPERLVFEGPPRLEPPLAQDLACRKPVVKGGGVLDTIKSCPPLSLVEAAKMAELRAREEVRLGPQIAKARAGFITEQTQRLAARGIPAVRARHIVERQCGGVLLPDLDLAFDDPELAGSTVADILADPEKFIDATLADPLEGVDYGPGKAKVLRRPDGGLMIHSFAHGGMTYELKLDSAAVKAILERTAPEEVFAVFVRCVPTADLDRIEINQLSRIVCKKNGIGKRDLDALLKEARAQQTAARRTAEFAAQRAARNDTRPQFFAPVADAPWLPEMDILSDILGKVDEPEPPLRDIDDSVHHVRVRRIPNMHAFGALGANAEEGVDSRLPAPEQPLFCRLTEPQLAELIERYVDYTDRTGRSVHLGKSFVQHFMVRADGLPLAVAIATLPLVLGDGALLKGPGLDRDRGIVFRVPSELEALLPGRQACTASAVAEAMRFLCDEWLVDVATGYVGKATLIAAALSVIERSLLPDRPVFWVTAGAAAAARQPR